MKNVLEHWRARNNLKLSQAALLISGNYPDNWTDEELLSAPPLGFMPIYEQLLEDAETVVDEGVVSGEHGNELYTDYAIKTDKFGKLKGLSDKDRLSVKVEMCEIKRWFLATGRKSQFFDDENLMKFESSEGDKPLRQVERNTLLIIIAALAKEAKIDTTKISKAASLIANLTEQMGVSVDNETIANKLKEIPNALESRAK